VKKLKRKMQKHDEKDPKNAVNNVTANLVIDFLKDHGHVAIASGLLKLGSKTDLPNLHGLKLADLVSFFSETQNPAKISSDNGIVASLVIDFLKDHGHHGIVSELLKMLQKQTSNLPELHGLKLTNLFSYFFQKNTEEKVSECKKTKVADDLHGLKLKDLDQYMSSVKEYPGDELNEWTTIQEAYGGKREAIKALDNGKSEVAKVIKYILDKNIPIKKIHAVTAAWKCVTHHQSDSHITMCISKANRSIAKLFKKGSFSSPAFGEKCEEVLTLRAFNELTTEVPINNAKQFMSDLFKHVSHNWPMGIVGCYLAKYLEAPRFAVKVCEFVAYKTLYNTGKFTKDEDVLVRELMHDENNVKQLSDLLNRPQDVIAIRINTLKKSSRLAGAKFNLAEDQIILKHALDNTTICSVQDMINVQAKRWLILENEIGRTTQVIAKRWKSVIQPTLIFYLGGQHGNDSWELEFLKFVMDSKANCASDVDWHLAKEKWPLCTKEMMNMILSNVANNYVNKETGLPLHERISKNFHKINSKVRTTGWLARRDELIEVFEEFREVTTISEKTRLKLL
jgi:hypothetical protein